MIIQGQYQTASVLVSGFRSIPSTFFASQLGIVQVSTSFPVVLSNDVDLSIFCKIAASFASTSHSSQADVLGDIIASLTHPVDLVIAIAFHSASVYVIEVVSSFLSLAGNPPLTLISSTQRRERSQCFAGGKAATIQ